MKTLYFDCAMGAAGDMLAASLLELFPNRQEVLSQLNAMGIPGVEFAAEAAVKCGIRGTHLRVLIQGSEEDGHHHHHTGMTDISHIVAHLQVSGKLKDSILRVYSIIAQGESLAHGVAVEQVHFHEVGAMDAIADIAAVCFLIDKLNPDRICASPVHVGSGQVQCAHGLLPVPAPATANILRGIPIYGGQIQGELCTPTGAALLKHFVTHFGPMPTITLSAVGYGMGKKDFPAPNCVRAMLGSAPGQAEDIIELSCNLDDITGEAIGFAMEQLLEAGALDVYTSAIGIKKSRPGILLRVLCRPEDRDTMVRQLFQHTTTLGIRENTLRRYTLTRRTETVQTPYGPVRQKIAQGYGVEKRKYEYEDLAKLARENHLSLNEIL